MDTRTDAERLGTQERLAEFRRIGEFARACLELTDADRQHLAELEVLRQADELEELRRAGEGA